MTRLLTLLLISQATAEWVEISQQHYRKPMRTHSPFNTPDRVIDFEDTTKTWTYNNRSVTEYNWNKNPARPPNISNVKRKQHESTKEEEEDDLDLHVDFRDYELRPNYGPTRPTTEHDKQKGSIERVPNVDNIKRVQLNNSPVKSPVVNYKGDREKYSNNRHENNPQDDDDDGDEVNEFKHKKNGEAFRRIYVNKVKNVQRTEITTLPPDDEEEATTFNTERPKRIYNNHTKVREFYSTKPTVIIEDFTNYDNQRNRFHKITNGKSSELTDKIFTTEIIDTDEVTTISPKRTSMKGNKNNFHKNINDFKAESHENKVQVTSNNEKPTNVISNDNKTKLKGHTDEPKQDNQSEKENLKDKIDKAPTDTKTEKNKVNTMENVMKFMRVVAETISKNTRRSFGGKMQYLHELKQSILANIGKRNQVTINYGRKSVYYSAGLAQ